jgi:hypothetical protein
LGNSPSNQKQIKNSGNWFRASGLAGRRIDGRHVTTTNETRKLAVCSAIDLIFKPAKPIVLGELNLNESIRHTFKTGVVGKDITERRQKQYDAASFAQGPPFLKFDDRGKGIKGVESYAF